eukprot:CAMPEP_0172783002 /NCGR_PEP_ID=MMETSP1074-20121228/204209_1 /TAXON_ID=2916 /ORGANISM="Ceratium fusus, Strain PA161109" /LENGTH=994 /DNA_ID=CAMNT_0013619989 /DNA_START=59 /DNA_END=3040 /DNA_ORIENTATION=-
MSTIIGSMRQQHHGSSGTSIAPAMAVPMQNGTTAVRMPGPGGSILAVAATGQPLVMQSTVRSLSPITMQVSPLRSVQALGNAQEPVYKDVRRIVSPTSAGASSQMGGLKLLLCVVSAPQPKGAGFTMSTMIGSMRQQHPRSPGSNTAPAMAVQMQNGTTAVRMPGAGGSILAVAAAGQPLVVQSTMRSLSPTTLQVSSLRSVHALGNVQDVVYKDVRRVVSPTSAGASSQMGAGSMTFDVIDSNRDGVITREEFVKAFQASMATLPAREQETSAHTPEMQQNGEDDEGMSTPKVPPVSGRMVRKEGGDKQFFPYMDVDKDSMGNFKSQQQNGEDDEGMSTPKVPPVSGRMVRKEGGDKQFFPYMDVDKDSMGNFKSQDFASRISQRVEDLRLREAGKSMARSVSVERTSGDVCLSPTKSCHRRTPKAEDASFSPMKAGHGSQSPGKRIGRDRTASAWRLPWSQPKSLLQDDQDDEGMWTPTAVPVSGRMVRKEGALGDEHLTLHMDVDKDPMVSFKTQDFTSRISQRVEDLRLRELGKSMTRSVSIERTGGDACSSPMKNCHGRTPKSEDASFSPMKTGQGSQSPGKRTGRERTSSAWRLPWSQPKSPVAPRLVVPYALPRESIAEKYAVNWNERVHTGLLNGLRSQQVCISSVFRAKAKNNSRLIAVRVVHRKHIAYPKLFQQQLSDMHNMDHPNICRLLDVYEDPHHVYLVFDYLSGPSLIEKALDDPQFSERDAAAAFKVVLQTMAYLHERNIVYQNLHPENLRYAAPPKKKGSGSAYGDQLKLLDFGLCLQSKHLSQDVQVSGTPDAHPLPLLQLVGANAAQVSPCPPPEYTGFGANVGTYAQLAMAMGSVEATSQAPRGNAGFGRDCPSPTLAKMRRDAQSPVRSAQAASALEDTFSRHVRELHRLLEAGDMWAAGCILHMLLTGTMPSECAEQRMFSGLPLDVQDLLSGLLRRDPRLRLTAAEALQSDWFRRWDALPKTHRSQAKAGS